MITIKDLINKILWDKKENKDNYILYYHDRLADREIELPFKDIKNVEGNFLLVEKNGEEAEIPMHRVRFVKKKGMVIWRRP